MPNRTSRREFLRISAPVSGGLLLAGRRKFSAYDAVLRSALSETRANGADVRPHSFAVLAVGAVEPRGWLRSWAQTAASGNIGEEEFSYVADVSLGMKPVERRAQQIICRFRRGLFPLFHASEPPCRRPSGLANGAASGASRSRLTPYQPRMNQGSNRFQLQFPCPRIGELLRTSAEDLYD